MSDDRTCMILEKTIDACQLLTCQVIVIIWPLVGETALGLQDLSGLLESGDVLCILDGHDLMVPSCLGPEMNSSNEVAHRISAIQTSLSYIMISIGTQLAFI